MTYLVKSIFFTLQGEGYNTGTPAVFCRFAGCNLWTGHEKQRSTATCQFCDTDFVGTDGPGGGHFKTAAGLASAVESMWRPQSSAHRFVVCTGGEPLLQLDESLVEAFHARGFRIAIETNGTREPPANIDWICVSPKAGAATRPEERQRAQARVPPAFLEPRRSRAARFRALLPAANGRARSRCQHRPRR